MIAPFLLTYGLESPLRRRLGDLCSLARKGENYRDGRLHLNRLPVQ